MNNFQIGADQLKTTRDSVVMLSELAGNNPELVQPDVDLLESLMLRQFYTLCKIVNDSPEMTDYYASALQRAQVTWSALDNLERSGFGNQALTDAQSAQTEEFNNLESFFALFVPENPTFVAYLGRCAQIAFRGTATAAEDEPVVAVEGTKSSDSEASEAETTGSLAQPESITSSLTAKPNPESSPFPETTPGKTDEFKPSVDFDKLEKYIKDAKLNQRKARILLAIARSAERIMGRDKDPAEWFKQGDIVFSEKEFVSPAAKNTAFSILTQRLIVNGVLEYTGERRGRRYRFSSRFTLKNPSSIEEAATTTPTTKEKATVETAATESKTAVTPPPALSTTPDLTPPRRERIKTKPEARARMDSQNRLLPTGIMLSRKVRPYEPLEREILTLLTLSPRKAPMGAGHIASSLGNGGARPADVEKVLKDLQAKLPDGWLTRIPQPAGNPDGWRLGTGVGIKSQRENATKPKGKR